MVYGHTLTTYSIPQKENKCNHMITIVVGWESSLILLSRSPTGHFSSKPKNCPVGFVAIVSTSYCIFAIFTLSASSKSQNRLIFKLPGIFSV